MTPALELFIRREKKRIHKAILEALPPSSAKPVSVHRAMRYAVLGGGKRLRPILTVVSYRACGGRGAAVYRVAAALELIHSFTLIHDDLPCMDDDTLRRGRPTAHVVFGEATALLAGDALLSLAFEQLSSPAVSAAVGPGTARALVYEVARATGTAGVVGGQVVDMESEGKKVSLEAVRYIHSHKTGSLITCALRVGGLMGGASRAQAAALTRYGRLIGLAFQIVDDIRDVTASVDELGKARARDRDRRKATYPKVAGVERSLSEASSLAAAAKREVRGFRQYRELLEGIADYIVNRAGVRKG